MVQGWVGVALATAFVLTTALCAVSLAVHGPRRSRRVAAAEANHVVMGVGMILMVAPATAGLVSPTVGVVLFGVAAVGWLGLLVVGRLLGGPLGSIIGCGRCTGHPVHLLALDAAMVVMYLAMLPPPMPAMAGMEGMDHGAHASSSPALTAVGVVLALYLAAHAVATAVVLRRTPEPVPAGGAALPGPVRVAVRGNVQLVGQAGMGLAMAAMLLVGH